MIRRLGPHRFHWLPGHGRIAKVSCALPAVGDVESANRPSCMALPIHQPGLGKQTKAYYTELSDVTHPQSDGCHPLSLKPLQGSGPALFRAATTHSISGDVCPLRNVLSMLGRKRDIQAANSRPSSWIPCIGSDLYGQRPSKGVRSCGGDRPYHFIPFYRKHSGKGAQLITQDSDHIYRLDSFPGTYIQLS